MKLKVIVILAVFLLASCSVTSDEIDVAKSLCKPNGGLKYVAQELGHVIVRCNNEAYFRI